ncbi:MAG: hypothetical protein IJN39_01085 [Clostridia bacterium]|nr:hypothetical protein [Clostridia bacterium]
MRKILLVFIILNLLYVSCHAAENKITEQYEITGANEILDVSSEVFPGFDSEKIVEDLANGKAFDTGRIIKNILGFFMQEFKNNLRICAVLLAMGFITGVLSNMQSSYGNGGSAEVGFFVAYCVFAGVLVAAFSEILEPAKEMIETVSVMINATIPVLLTLLTMSGGVVTSGFMSGGLVMLSNIINSVISGIVFPLIMCSFSLSVTENL